VGEAQVDPHLGPDSGQRLVWGVDDERGVIRPAASTVTVTDVGSDGSARDQRTGTSPTPGRRGRPLGSTRNRAAFVNRIDCARSRRDRNRGAPRRRPLRVPFTEAKKFR
jgi:hypothetical protein